MGSYVDAAVPEDFTGRYEVRYVVTMRRQAGNREWSFPYQAVEFVDGDTALTELVGKILSDPDSVLDRVIHRRVGDGG